MRYAMRAPRERMPPMRCFIFRAALQRAAIAPPLPLPDTLMPLFYAALPLSPPDFRFAAFAAFAFSPIARFRHFRRFAIFAVFAFADISFCRLRHFRRCRY